MGSEALTPGTILRHKRSAAEVVLSHRKEGRDATPHPGWWLKDNAGGLADFVIDAEHSDWEVVAPGSEPPWTNRERELAGLLSTVPPLTGMHPGYVLPLARFLLDDDKVGDLLGVERV